MTEPADREGLVPTMPVWMVHIHSRTWHLYNRTWDGLHIAECGAPLSLERTEDSRLGDQTGFTNCKHCLKAVQNQWRAAQHGDLERLTKERNEALATIARVWELCDDPGNLVAVMAIRSALRGQP